MCAKLIFQKFYLFLPFLFTGCFENAINQNTKNEIPVRHHDLSYIPFDAKTDNPDFIVCDSTTISSGRNRLQYANGNSKLIDDIKSKFTYKQAYESFNGYIVIRFLVNCKSNSGRYRAQALNLDFSPSNAPSDLVEHLLKLIKSLDNWTKRSTNDLTKEYSKFINLKINNGKIQHVLL